MAHNVAGTGGGSFSGASVSSGFNVEDLSVHVDIYYWFDKGIKRKNELKFCVFCDTT